MREEGVAQMRCNVGI